MGKHLRMKLPRSAELPASPSIAEEEERGARLQRQIGRKLRYYRTARGFTLESLARVCDIDAAVLQAAESGEAMPSLGMIWKVAKALDVSCLAITAESEEAIDMSLRSDTQANLAAGRG